MELFDKNSINWYNHKSLYFCDLEARFMEFYQDPKFYTLVLAFIFGIPSFLFYWIPLLKGKADPHPVSWTIWLVNQAIVTVNSIFVWGGYGVVYNIFYCFTISVILLTTLKKYGIKNVEKKDVICLIVSLAATPFLFSTIPFVALVIAIGVDLYAFGPTFRNVKRDPSSEPLWGWLLSIPNLVFTALSMAIYEKENVAYQIVMAIATAILVGYIIYKQKTESKQKA